jgi:preprotein translocase subunit SecF
VEFFRNTNIDFLGKKWYFLAFSLIFSVSGILSMLFWHGIPTGIEFRGGTEVVVKFAGTPNAEAIRKALNGIGLHNFTIQPYGTAADNEELIRLDLAATGEQAGVEQGKAQITKALSTNAPEGKTDLNSTNTTVQSIQDELVAEDPLHIGINVGGRYLEEAQKIIHYRDAVKGGVLGSLDELKNVTSPEVLAALQNKYYVSNFSVRGSQSVGPQVGRQLQKQAFLAVMYSLAGMLVYLWFRFELIYGVAAVVAVFHDTLITIGAFSLTNQEISLTVIAALLTLVGYSMNDTIVVFDRIRENVKLLRREGLAEIVNKSINQTLSRTILTSGLTFLTVLSLYLFGGEVLHGFSFALVIGILIGTYSSIAIAAPMLVAYQEWRISRSGRRVAPVAIDSARKEKVRAKA